MRRRKTGSLGDLPKGALSGLRGGSLGTLAMSVVMIVGQRAGLMGKQPPQRIAEAAVEAVGRTPHEHTTKPLGALAHVGFGAGMGALFGVLQRRLPTGVPDEASGVAFALAVWTVSYKGWVPAMGIMPPPERDRPGRPIVMILAHIVYGFVLGRTVASVGQRRT